jgi:REP element-mobilizing transposase RayT
MARLARGYVPAGLHHVNTRGAGPAAIFRDDFDRTLFCMHLIRTMVRLGWVCVAFVFMTTHYHLVLDTPAETLQSGMRRLNGDYAQAFNRRHGRSGHLFGERYYDARVESDEHLLNVLRYLALNPVAAGLCERPGDWYWGSYRGCVRPAESFPFVDSTTLLSYFTQQGEVDVLDIRRFVEGE